MGLYKQNVEQEKHNKLSDRFHKILMSEEGSEARSYLANRKIKRNSIEQFKIGYCPDKKGLSGLLSYMSGRAVFPVIDEFENTTAFTWRIIRKKREKEQAWLHESFPKTYFPYGLHIAWKNIIKQNSVIIVEGQIDVIRMWQHGFTNTVAILGGAFNDESIAKLSRFTNRFITIFDGDDSGRDAAQRTINFLQDYGSSGYEHLDVNLRINGKQFDPDEFLLERGSRQMVALIKKASDNRKKKKREQKIEDMILWKMET